MSSDRNTRILDIVEDGLMYLSLNRIKPIYIELSDRQLLQIRKDWEGDLLKLFQSGSEEYGILGYPVRIVLGKFFRPVYIIGKIDKLVMRYGFDTSKRVVSKEILNPTKKRVSV